MGGREGGREGEGGKELIAPTCTCVPYVARENI